VGTVGGTHGWLWLFWPSVCSALVVCATVNLAMGLKSQTQAKGLKKEHQAQGHLALAPSWWLANALERRQKSAGKRAPAGASARLTGTPRVS
jgi:hypothetical protein